MIEYRYLLLQILLLISSISIAQQKKGIEFYSEDFYYLLYDEVNLRADADVNSDLVEKLPIATKVKIVSIHDSTLTINGYTNNWCEVNILDENNKSSGINGFLWVGFIAEDYEISKEDEGVIFLFGTSGIVEGEYSDKFMMQIRAAKDNEQLAKIEFEAVGSESTNRFFSISDNKGIRNITNILDCNFSDDFCGGAFGNVIIYWDKAVLHYVTTLRSGSDAPYFSERFFIYPDDEEGIKKYIILKEEAGEELYDGTINYELKKETKYFWNGCELIEE